MRLDRVVFTIDTHTAGEATRIVVGGLPHVPGETMADKMRYLEKNVDSVRTALMQEPRGHKNMYGAILTPPVSQDSAFGVIFIDTNEYWSMCGHGSIGVVTAAIEMGMVEGKEPVTMVRFDVPAGVVTAKAEVIDGVVKSVTIKNVPSFFYKATTLKLPKFGDIHADIAFGGNFCIIINAKDIGVRVRPENSSKLIEIGMTIKDAANTRIDVQHPEMPHINRIHQVLIYDDPVHKEAYSKNIIVSGKMQADRSPCGTGTSARMATLYAKKQLKLNQDFVNESIIGTLFKGRLVSKCEVGRFGAVIPEITGSAYITGFCTFIMSKRDPLKSGFLMF